MIRDMNTDLLRKQAVRILGEVDTLNHLIAPLTAIGHAAPTRTRPQSRRHLHG